MIKMKEYFCYKSLSEGDVGKAKATVAAEFIMKRVKDCKVIA